MRILVMKNLFYVRRLIESYFSEYKSYKEELADGLNLYIYEKTVNMKKETWTVVIKDVIDGTELIMFHGGIKGSLNEDFPRGEEHQAFMEHLSKQPCKYRRIK